MFQSTRTRRSSLLTSGVDITPLVDIVFILLVFFLVTTTFRRDHSIPIERPAAATADRQPGKPVRVFVAASGDLYVDGDPLSLAEVRERVAASLTKSEGNVMVVPDRTVPSGRLIEVVDEARAAGASAVTIATLAPE